MLTPMGNQRVDMLAQGAEPVRVLIVGGGGRDHALAWALAQSPRCAELHAAPGNPGMARIATCHPHIAPDDIDAMVALAQRLEIDLVVVGAEDLLVAGISSRLHEAGIACFGPSQAAAQLEGSKTFAKQLMDDAGVPTADWVSCETPEEAYRAIARFGGAVAVKTDGLAAGCGAFVCRSAEHAEQVVHDMMVRRLFGAAGDRIIVEALITGREVSVMAFTDGTHVVPLPAARDYKRLADHDMGPNTGGMGAHAPSHDIDEATVSELAVATITPIVRALAVQGTPFRGVIYAGVMLTDDGYRVLEYNCRFGNPETQALVRVADTDLLEVMYQTAVGGLAGVSPIRAHGYAAAVCIAAPNYPQMQLEPEAIQVRGITAAEAVPGVVCFMSLGQPIDASSDSRDAMMAMGGRVVTVSAHADSMEVAIRNAYQAVDMIDLPGGHWRSDIGSPALAMALSC